MEWLKEYLPQLIYWIVTGVFTAVCGIMGKQIRKAHKENEKTKKENEAQRRLLKALAQIFLYYIAEKHQEQGFCSMAEKRDMEMIYDPYRELGWNGTGKVSFEITMNLPNGPKNE